MLTATEIAAMRAVLDTSLPDSGTIVRATLVDNGAGGQTPTWAAAGTVLCRVSPTPLTPTEQVDASDAPAARRAFVVTFPHGTDVRATDRVQFGGDTYELVGVDAPRSWSLDVRANAIRRSQ